MVPCEQWTSGQLHLHKCWAHMQIAISFTYIPLCAHAHPLFTQMGMCVHTGMLTCNFRNPVPNGSRPRGEPWPRGWGTPDLDGLSFADLAQHSGLLFLFKPFKFFSFSFLKFQNVTLFLLIVSNTMYLPTPISWFL